MKKYLLAFLILLSSLHADDKWNYHYSEGIRLITEGKNEEGLEKIDACINFKGSERDFFYWDACLRKAYALAGLQKYDDAIDLITEVIENTESNSLEHEAFLLRMTCNMLAGNVDAHIDDIMALTKHKHSYNADSIGKKTVISYIQDPLHFSLSKTKCFLIHNRLTYGKDDVKMISPTHYTYNSLCLCGCPEAKSKIKNVCDECGAELLPIPDEKEGKENIEEIRKMYDEAGLDYDEYQKAIERRSGDPLGKISLKYPFFAAINYPAPLYSTVAKSSCNTACWSAKVAACGWCDNRFKDSFPKKIACQDFAIHLESECYNCCKSKNDFVACTGPFGRIGKQLYNIWEQAGNALACNWGCYKCGHYNENSWPPFVCRGCGKFKNG